MSMSKFKSLVHDVIHRCRDHPHRLGAVRLNKVLWFSDMYAYKFFGHSISGEIYVKRQRGPVPRRVLSALKELQTDGAIRIEEPRSHLDTRKFYSMVPPPEGVLTSSEEGIVSEVLAGVLGYTANEISEASHGLAWETAEMGEEIPLSATLAETPGEYTDEIMKWAKKEVARLDLS